ncbi:hypothetical protein [Microbacterium sp. NIBRBAC000506063]|uniref:hypothetical protein n=1 Tax=Microbacterium sp. NIBRBAC000506063 TaxID=2734618 RepID=UPI001BB6AC4A|nr:hypothetical protein [Microbacterium sp. NIBRBAC000506063]QTV80176.1 hypothetical protein KAE78_03730 [Microbacterium sp. NIBRBAC000506063]
MGGKVEPHVLELRIHGIANAPPEKVLGVTRDEIVSAGHDDLGGFWRYKNPPSPPSEDTPLVRTDDDPRIRTEAYSWGNMARSGATAGAVVVAILVQIGWLLTLPFGLCNAAYWTRRITRTQAAAGREWLGGAGSSTIRLFALGLTLLLTSALASVALDFIGTQCYREQRCARGCPRSSRCFRRRRRAGPCACSSSASSRSPSCCSSTSSRVVRGCAMRPAPAIGRHTSSAMPSCSPLGLGSRSRAPACGRAVRSPRSTRRSASRRCWRPPASGPASAWARRRSACTSPRSWRCFWGC